MFMVKNAKNRANVRDFYYFLNFLKNFEQTNIHIYTNRR